MSVPAFGSVVIVIISTSEDEVFLQDDGDVDSQPVSENVQEVLEGGRERVGADDSERDVDGSNDEWPHESRNGREPFGNDGNGHAHRVDVDNVVGND